MRTKDFQSALLYLRLIRQKNPEDANAKVQLQKVEKRIQAEKLEIIGKLVEQKEEDEFMVLMNSFESEPWEHQPEGSILVSARQYLDAIEKSNALTKCQAQIRKLHDYFDSGDWQSGVPYLSSIKQLLNKHGFSLNQIYENDTGKSYQSQLEMFENWIEKETGIERNKRENHARLVRLKSVLGQIEDNKFLSLAEQSQLPVNIVEDAGHNTHNEQPALFSQLILQLINL